MKQPPKNYGAFIAIFLNLIANADPFPNLIFHGTYETLSKITEIITNKQKGAYLRFGDGDVNLAVGMNELLQSANPQLTSEMQEAFALQGPSILKTLPLYCKELNGWEIGMFPGNHECSYEWCLKLLDKAKNIWNGHIEDVYSHAALHFAATQNPNLCINFFKFLKKSNCCLFIGNKNIPVDIREMLFGTDCIFIPTPPEQSYNEIDRIEQECLKNFPQTSDYKIVITAMGCSGRVLQKRLWQKLDNVFLFDFGSLMDALCGWNTRAWIELTNFDANKFIGHLKSEVKILYTAALIDFNFDQRKKEYIKTLEILSSYGYTDPYIVEAIKSGPPTFLDNYSCNIAYSNINDSRLHNKGVNEARSLLEAFKILNFNDNDIVVKITGRYYFTSNEFLMLVENNPTVDAFVKTDSSAQVFTGCFALRYKYFKEFLEQLDLAKMEQEMINIEQEIAHYLKKILQIKNVKIMSIDNLNVVANVWGDGSAIHTNYW